MRILYVLCMVVVTATIAAAQTTPQWELFGGFQYTRLDTPNARSQLNLFTQELGFPAVSLGSKIDLQGWDFSLGENRNSWFGGVIDFSGNYTTKNALLAQVGGFTDTLQGKIRYYTLTAGPQFTLRKSSRLQPFARALFGGEWLNVASTELVNGTPATPIVTSSDVGFTLAGGGGIDIRLLPHVAVRGAGDYLRSYVGSETENNFRVAGGLVFQIGSK